LFLNQSSAFRVSEEEDHYSLYGPNIYHKFDFAGDLI